MTFSNTIYFVEVKEADGTIKRVPHTDKKHCNFLEGKKATNFLNALKEKHPDRHFRRVKQTTRYNHEDWL